MDKKFIIISCIILIFLSLITYSNSFKNDFVWDDEFLVTSNDLIKDVRNWRKILTQELLDKSKTDYYRPVQSFSYCLDYSLYKLNPAGYHLTNFLFHLSNAFLLLFSFYLISGSKFVSFLSGIFFAVHPAHTESVSYISGRADLLAGFFILSALLCYIFQFKSVKFKTLLNLSSALLFSLALFSKEVSIVFPLFLIGYEVLFHRQIKGCPRRLFIFFFIDTIYVLMRLTILNFSGSYFWLKSSVVSPVNIIRFFSFLKGMVLYLKLLFLPQNIHLENYIAPARSPFDPHVLSAISIIFVFLLILKRQIKHKNFIIFGIFWFFIFLFPQSNFFFTFVLASHFLYLPSAGIFFALAYGFNELYLKKRYFAITVITVIVVFWSLVAFSQNYIWRNSLSLYLWMDKLSPYSYLARNNLANLYAYLGMEDLAITKYEQALLANPNTGAIKENIAKVENNFIEKYRGNLKKMPYSAAFNYNLAYLYQRKGRVDEAIIYYKKAIEINPKFSEAISNLGNVYERQGKFEQALRQYREAVSTNPNFAQAYFNIGVVLAEQGKLKEAQGYFEKALKINPDYRKARDYVEQIKEMLKNSN